MIPKRALGALLATAMGLALLLNFRTPEDGTLVAVRGTTGSDGRGGTASTAGRTGRTGDTGGTGTSRGTTDAQGTPAPAPVTSGSGKTVTGPAVDFQYGTVQVQVTIADGRIADVQAVQMPSFDRHSMRLSRMAEPQLRESALQAQSANVDLVSGATYTSMAYAQSLQGALDAAGYRA